MGSVGLMLLPQEFASAISHYDRALELFDEDISFLTNRAAVHFEMAK